MPPQNLQGRSIAVVGAGLAGLAAARQLAEEGAAVEVLERAPRVGGRAALARVEGATVDPLGTRIGGRDTRLLSLIHAAGLDRILLPVRRERMLQLSLGALAEAARPRVTSVGQLTGVGTIEALRLVRLERLMRRYAARLDAEWPECGEALDDRSLSDFGALYFGRGVVERWMEPWMSELAPLDEREASRVSFLLRHATERGAPAALLREPIGILAETLAGRLTVRTATAVTTLEPLGDMGLRLRLEDEAALDVDAVVLATPAFEALRIAEPLLVAAERSHLAGVRYDPSLTWVVGAEARHLPVATPARVRAPRCDGRPFSALVLDPAATREGDARITAVARPEWVRARASEPDDSMAKDLGASVARVCPRAIDPARLALLSRFPEAWPRFDVGAYRSLARFRRVQADRRARGRRLYFAGDHLIAPSLEGAVVSGRRAAEDVLRDLVR